MKPGPGTVAVVTGAASGMGRALALDLAARGAALALADRDGERLAVTALLARPFGVEVTTHALDVSDAGAVAAFAAEVETAHGRADLLINNAGVALGGAFEELDLDDLRWILGVNFWGVVHGCHAFLPLLRREREARVVNVSSLFGLIAPPGQTGYSASKFAVRGFSEALRHELRGTSVGLSVVHPGGVKTNIARSARLGARSVRTPEEVARDTEAFERLFVLSARDAAARILLGVERREPRILVGRDAVAGDLLGRLLPGRYWDVLGKLLDR